MRFAEDLGLLQRSTNCHARVRYEPFLLGRGVLKCTVSRLWPQSICGEGSSCHLTFPTYLDLVARPTSTGTGRRVGDGNYFLLFSSDFEKGWTDLFRDIRTSRVYFTLVSRLFASWDRIKYNWTSSRTMNTCWVAHVSSINSVLKQLFCFKPA